VLLVLGLLLLTFAAGIAGARRSFPPLIWLHLLLRLSLLLVILPLGFGRIFCRFRSRGADFFL
jgi:hypothetical protein